MALHGERPRPAKLDRATVPIEEVDMSGWDRRIGGERRGGMVEPRGGESTPGKRTLTESLPATDVETAAGGGAAVDAGVASRFTHTTGADVSDVRVHTDAGAASSASRLSSLAYTVGRDIHFAAGQYQPSSESGQRLIAHELTHTVQQGPGGAVTQAKLEVSGADSATETEADTVAAAVVRGERATVNARVGPQIARQTPTPAPPPTAPTAAQQAQHDTAVASHLAQVQRVYGLIRAGLAATPPAGAALLDRTTLFRNACQWIDQLRCVTRVLSLTHDSATRHAGKLSYFDVAVAYPATTAQYDVLPGPDENAHVIEVPSGWQGGMSNNRLELFNPAARTDDELTTTIIHEVQHAADQTGFYGGAGSPMPGHASAPPTAGGSPDLAADGQWNDYQTEFRAHWIETQEGDARDPYGSSTAPAGNGQVVQFTDPVSHVAQQQATAFHNQRQERVFWHLIRNRYAYERPYVQNAAFRAMVDAFERPVGVNLVNSVRIQALTDLVNQCNTNQEVRHPKVLAVFAAAEALDGADKRFLNDQQLSRPFWDHLRAHLGPNPLHSVEGRILIPPPPPLKGDFPGDPSWPTSDEHPV